MTDQTTPGTVKNTYKIEMVVQTAIQGSDVAGLLDYLIGGAMHINFLTIDQIGDNDN